MSLPIVVFIDDEENILSAINRLCRKEIFQSFFTSNPDQVIEWVQTKEVAVVVSDQRMPDMDGTLLLEKVRSISPNTIRIILTGYADLQSAVEAINKCGVWRFMNKPWNENEFKFNIQQAIAQYNLVEENIKLNSLIKQQNDQLKEMNQSLEDKVKERTSVILQLNQQLKSSLLETIKLLGQLTEMHSPLIGNHSKRVAVLSREIGKAMELNSNELFELEIAAILHDIGKIGLPQTIMKKNESQMSKQEREIYLSHIIRGEVLISKITGLGNVVKIIRHHHEYYNGQGFPDKLRESNIPLASQIISVADLYDNALNDKSLFQVSSSDKSLQYISNFSGTRLSPQIIKVLVQCIKDIKGEVFNQVESEINLEDLAENMVISRNIVSTAGVMLVKKDSKMTKTLLEQLKQVSHKISVVDNIYIYRNPKG
ncbi:MAG: Response regulator receiver [uncultured bacterium]|nr:MAG: Response regulator receiver [uncultured bacterium]